MKTILNKQLSYRLLFFFLLAVLLILLLPVFSVSRYAVPQGDDFGFSVKTHAVVEAGDSLFSVLTAAIVQAVETWKTWQGTFSAIFMMALQPGIWGVSCYGIITTAFLLIFLFGSCFLFCLRFFSDVCSLPRFASASIAALLCIFYLEFLPCPFQGLYWYNGAVYYTFFHSLFFIATAVSIEFLRKRSIRRIVILIPLSFFIGGGNYSSALMLILFYAAIVLALIICKDKSWRVFLLPLIAVLSATMLSAAAPGNAAREAGGGILWMLESIFCCFRDCLSYLAKWISLPWAAMMVLMFPIFYSSIPKDSIRFRYPALVTLCSFCILSAMFAPTEYALRFEGSSRLINMYYYTFLILSSINLLWWVGWFKQRKEGSGKKYGEVNQSVPILLTLSATVLSCVLLGASILLTHSSMTSILAVSELRTGEANSFYTESCERFSVLQDDAVPDAVFAARTSCPYLLFESDMTDDPDFYMNADAATYFHKNSVIVS